MARVGRFHRCKATECPRSVEVENGTVRVGNNPVTAASGETVTSPAPGSAVTVSSIRSWFDGSGIRRSAYCREHWAQFTASATPYADAVALEAPVRPPATQAALRALFDQQEQ